MDAHAATPGRFLVALQHTGFRWFLVGRAAASATGYIRGVAEGWLVYQLTGSALALGWVSTASAISAILLAPFGGITADRLPKRQILIVARLLLLVNLLVLTALVVSGAIRVWHVAVVAVLDSAIFAFLGPAMSSLPIELVDRDALMNANSLDYAVEGIVGVGASALAGVLTESLGASTALGGAALLVAVAAYTHTRLPHTLPGAAAAGDGAREGEGADPGRAIGVRGALAGAVRTIAGNRIVTAIFALAAVRMLFIVSAGTFQPAYVKTVLGLGAASLGVLVASRTAGYLASSIVAARISGTRHKGRILIVAGMAAGATYLAIAALPMVPTVYILVFLMGAAMTFSAVVHNTLLQSHVEPSYRGRVMSMMSVLSALTSFWVLPAGMLVDRVGVLPVLAAQGALTLICFGIVVALTPAIWRLP